MKEIDLNGIIFLEYDDERIYENNRRIRFWYGISLIISIIITIADITLLTTKNAWVLDWWYYVFYFELLIFIPWIFWIDITRQKNKLKKPSTLADNEIELITKRKRRENETTENFKYSTAVCNSLAPIFLQFGLAIMWGMINLNRNFINAVSEYLGASLIHYIFIYIAVGIGIKNCKLMKKEWETSPPQSEQLIRSQKEKEKKKIEYEEKQMECKKLIEQCGIRFFVKYYKQITLLPLRDVNVVENYDSAEREERLSAAKKIIDEGMTEIALNEILSTYSNVLGETETEQIKSILSELTENQKEQKIEIMEKN